MSDTMTSDSSEAYVRTLAVWWRGAWWPVPAGGSGEDDDSGDGTGDEGGDDDGDGSGDDGSADDGSEGGEGDGDEQPQFTQADLDKRIQERLERERKKHNKQLEREREKARKEAQQAKDDAGDAGGDDSGSDERVEQLQRRAVKAEAKSAALAAGVDSQRMGRFLRLVDLDDVDVDDDGEVDEDEVADRVRAALDEVPEFAAAKSDDGEGKAKRSTSSNGHRGEGKTQSWTREQIAKMSDAEFEKHHDEIQKAIAEGKVT